MERKLAAILAADVVGYSRLMEADEAGTLAALKSHRHDLTDPEIAAHHGRIVKLMGDGALVEFASVVDAVTCAVVIQKSMIGRNEGLPEDRRIEFRIGVHLGDVIVEDDDLYGDGVNVAARLEGLAEPGGICISQQAYDQVETKLDISYQDLGEQQVKNIARSIHVWRWSPGVSPLPVLGPTEGEGFSLPDKPSIAVLPFNNMSGDPEQEYFSDGITEDIITALSRSPWLFVIARNSSFSYRGSAVDVRQVARELGVRFVLDGSVRKVGNRVRVNAQLVDGVSGSHIWAEKYDGQLEDIFDLQDEITQNVVASTQTQIQLSPGNHVGRLDRPNIRVWDLVAQGWKLFYELKPDSLKTAQRLLRQAVDLDPNSCEANLLLAGVITHAAQMGYSEDLESDLEEAFTLARRAVDLEDRNEYAHWILGFILLWRRNHDDAIGEMERAIVLNPNCSLAYGSLGTTLSYAGMPEESIKNNEIAIRSNPLDISIFFRFSGIAMAHFVAKRYDKAAEWARKAIQRKSDWWVGHVLLIASLGQLDQLDEASKATERLLTAFPKFGVADIERLPFKAKDDAERFALGLRKAGL